MSTVWWRIVLYGVGDSKAITLKWINFVTQFVLYSPKLWMLGAKRMPISPAQMSYIISQISVILLPFEPMEPTIEGDLIFNKSSMTIQSIETSYIEFWWYAKWIKHSITDDAEQMERFFRRMQQSFSSICFSISK